MIVPEMQNKIKELRIVNIITDGEYSAALIEDTINSTESFLSKFDLRKISQEMHLNNKVK